METEMTELSQPMLLDGTPPRAVEAPAARTVLHSPSFRQLMAIKRRAVVPLLGASLAFTFGVALLSGFAPALMSLKISGSFTLGYLLVVAIYVVCWAVSVAYVSIANRAFDALATSVAGDIHGDRS
jgi:uncharacterized membrane protein (DUF485 family)